jgi:hypothetical protein
MDAADYGLIEPFDTDDGSMRDVNSEEAFALGVEWEIWRQRLKADEPFKAWCLENNAPRLAKMAKRHGRSAEIRQTDWPGWSELRISACAFPEPEPT